MRLKETLVFIILFGNTPLLQGQSKEILAKSAMLNAESSYENGNYKESLDFLKEVELSLGKTNSRIQYVKVKSLIVLGTQNGYEKDFLVKADQELKEFFKVTPENSYVPEKYDEMVLELTRVKQMIAKADKEIEMDNQLFAVAKNTNTTDAYKQYIDRYPKGRSVLEAEEKIKELIRQKELQAEIQEHTNTINNIPKKKRMYLEDIEKRSNAFFKRGNAKFELKDFQGAIEDYTEYVDWEIIDFPEKENAYLNRGMAKLRLKEYQGAIHDFNKALELNPQAKNAYLLRGNAKSGIKDYQGAIQDYTKAIELAPQSASAFFTRGYTKSRFEDYSGAIQDYSRAIELYPEYLSAYFYRGKIYNLKIKNTQAAKSDFEKVVMLNADLSLTAFSHFYLGNKVKAYGILNDMVKDAGDNKEKLMRAHYNLSCLFSLDGNKNEAIEALENALANGYNNFSWIAEDENLANIRNSIEFLELVDKYKK